MAASAWPFLSASSSLHAIEEAGGGWDEKWINIYTNDLVTWFKQDFSKRAALVENTLGAPVPLNYNYFAEPLSGKNAAFMRDFLEGSLPAVASTRHIKAWLKDLENVRAALASKEADAFPKWKQPEDAAEPAMLTGKVYETAINSRNLGVVLDNSNSMLPYLDKVRAEISREFSGACFVEVNGCQMWRGTVPAPWFYASAVAHLNPFAPERHCPAIPQVLDKAELAAAQKKDRQFYYTRPYQLCWNWKHDAASALLAMVQLMKVDAIYWFTDFDDPIDDAVLKTVATPLLAAKVKLYATRSRLSPRPWSSCSSKNPADSSSKKSSAETAGVIVSPPRPFPPSPPLHLRRFTPLTAHARRLHPRHHRRCTALA